MWDVGRCPRGDSLSGRVGESKNGALNGAEKITGGGYMAGDLFTIIDISRPDATGLSDHERAILDFLKWLGRPHERPFAWLDELNDCSLEFWTEASSLLGDLVAYVQEIRLLKEKQPCRRRIHTGRRGGGVGVLLVAPRVLSPLPLS